jgi:hypothetical protein
MCVWIYVRVNVCVLVLVLVLYVAPRILSITVSLKSVGDYNDDDVYI